MKIHMSACSWRLALAVFAACAVGFQSAADAKVRLPGFFGDHMVLQQESKIRVWGWADPGEKVTVTLGNSSANETADDAGKWTVSLPPMKASLQPHSLTVKGSNTITLSDVLIGEVWLCSGQSNMEWVVANSTNSSEEIAAADFPMIRHLKVEKRPSNVPLDDIDAPWKVCSPATVGSFTACGYFMARELQKELGVPIGLLNSSWGGTRVEPWTPPVGFKNVDAVKDIYQSVLDRTPGTTQHRALLGKHIDTTEKWVAQAKAALQSDTDVAPSPAYPNRLAPFTSHQDPTMLYNGMIHALVGYPIRGAIWYQGESNHGEGKLYTEKKKALIGGWRELWDQGDFPFYYVQIAPYMYGEENPAVLAEFWEAQAAVQQIPATGMVVTNDIATLDNIHPPNKQDVGYRLALLALKNDYGRDVVANSPEMESMEVLPGKLKINFKNTGGGLKPREEDATLSHFEVLGAGTGGYQEATAVIDGDSVILTSTNVKDPVAFRFAWNKLAEPNLIGGTGLPVGAFRGGEEPDFLSQLPVGEDYQLVYDLDLARLSGEIKYDADNSDQVTTFERVGYLLELRDAQGLDQAVFVTMDAFTDDVKKIGIPTVKTGASFGVKVKSMDVYSNVDELVIGKSIETGNIEFWPNNYGPGNDYKVAGASDSKFDFGDFPSRPADGYGSMQVHNFGAKQTIFALNRWSNAAAADIGIGNSKGDNSDWTFSSNGQAYTKKRLRIFVK